MRVTDEKLKEFIGDEAPTTDGGKLRLILASFIKMSESIAPRFDWRENEINDDILRIADKLDSQSGGVAPQE